MDKDLEILVLRYQLGIADRKLNQTIKPNRIEKLTLAVLVNRLKSATHSSTNQLRSSLRLFSLRTIFRWHNELVKRKWTTSIRTREADQSSAKTYKSWLSDWPKKSRDGDTVKLRANSSSMAS
jgi:hypothetical protein